MIKIQYHKALPLNTVQYRTLSKAGYWDRQPFGFKQSQREVQWFASLTVFSELEMSKGLSLPKDDVAVWANLLNV